MKIEDLKINAIDEKTGAFQLFFTIQPKRAILRKAKKEKIKLVKYILFCLFF